jgi:carbon-monoxide dehydrogenase large subunit
MPNTARLPQRHLARRPVKWIEDRHENFLSTQQERDQYWDVEIALDRDAKILGVRGKLVHDAGAYMPWGVVLPWIAATSVPGPYVIPNFRLDVSVAFTNKVPTSPVRGAGRPEAAVVMERLMDRAARELKLDRAEVRRRNFIQPSQMPYKVGIIFRDGRSVTYDSGDYPTCQQKALDAADYDGFAARQAAARKAGRYIGLGIGNAVEATGLGPYESAVARVSTSGKLTVYTGATPQGQSHKTSSRRLPPIISAARPMTSRSCAPTPPRPRSASARLPRVRRSMPARRCILPQRSLRRRSSASPPT